MRSIARKSVYCALIASYTLIATAGTFVAYRSFINPGDDHLQLDAQKKSRPIDQRPTWTQQKHLISSTKIEASAATISSAEKSGLLRHSIPLGVTRHPAPLVELVRLPSKPRDPPAV